MRKLLTGLVVAATTAVLPTLALADNQETANEIARRLREGGQLTNFKVGVKYQDGTAWLRGEVQNQQQMNAALKTVFATDGVTRVVNGLSITSPTAGKTATSEKAAKAAVAAGVGKTIRRATGALSPDQNTMAQRLQRVIGTASPSWEQTAPKPATGRAQRISNSVSQAPARVASATTPRHVAQPLQRALPAGMVTHLSAPAARMATAPRSNRPIPVAYIQNVGGAPQAMMPGGPIPAHVPGVGGGVAPARYDQPHLPNYSWPSYSAYPNYAALTYPRQYSPTAWPFIGPFYPYPQVPLGWRKVTLEWDDGWWMLDFQDSPSGHGYK